jgi:hypothetical protein
MVAIRKPTVAIFEHPENAILVYIKYAGMLILSSLKIVLGVDLEMFCRKHFVLKNSIHSHSKFENTLSRHQRHPWHFTLYAYSFFVKAEVVS